MIKFFRQIRQNLLMVNKTGNYFKYAIGDIVIVVIGILIALSINNWNEERKLQITKQPYLQQLIVDLEVDKNYAQRNIINLHASLTKFNHYNEIFKEPNLPFETIVNKIADNSFKALKRTEVKNQP
jgi:hypothetical protein